MLVWTPFIVPSYQAMDPDSNFNQLSSTEIGPWGQILSENQSFIHTATPPPNPLGHTVRPEGTRVPQAPFGKAKVLSSSP